MSVPLALKPLVMSQLVSSPSQRSSAEGENGGGPQQLSNRSTRQRFNVSTDPENRWLWRMNPGQMEAEVVRDSILHLAGELDLAPVGYPLPTAVAETNRHRSLYFECFPEPNGARAGIPYTDG